MGEQRALSRHTVIALGFMVYFFSYAMRLDYSATLVAMVPDLQVTNTMASAAVTGSYITYGIGQVLCGFIGDRVSPIKMIQAAMLGTAVVNLLVSFCSNIWIITVLWSINGICQAMTWPPLARFVIENIEREKYVDAITAIGLSASVGTIFIYLIVPFFLEITVWRNVFRFMFAFGMLALGVWSYATRKISMGRAQAVKGTSDEKRLSVWRLIGLAGLVPIFVAIVLQGTLRDGIQVWLPSLVNEKFGLGASSSVLSTVALPLLSMISLVISNVVYHKLRDELKTAAIMFGIAFSATVPLALSLNVPVIATVIFASLIAACMHGVNHMLISLVASHFSRYGRLSTFSGLMNSFTYIGASISSYGFAALSDQAGWSAVQICWCVTAGLGTLICLLKIKSWDRFIEE